MHGSVESVKGHKNKSVNLRLEIWNDDDVNGWFGWDIMKLKKKYSQLINHASMSSVYDEKWEILEDMSVYIFDVVENTRYLRLYYLLGDAISNKEKLAILQPKYCDSFSFLLKLIY